MDTRTAEYSARLRPPRWKVLLDVQAPYRWNLRRLNPGYTLDVGCGIGRNLVNLDGVGIDHNRASVHHARSLGLKAFHTTEFEGGSFDSLLFAHVLEHMTRTEAKELVGSYLAYLKPGGLVIMITPQERGFASDDTHVDFLNFRALGSIAKANGLSIERSYSFPFPRVAGRIFKYNEFVVTARYISSSATTECMY